MSAPDTNTEKQARRHRGPLIGILVAVIVAGFAAVYFTGADDLVEEDATTSAADDIQGN